MIKFEVIVFSKLTALKAWVITWKVHLEKAKYATFQAKDLNKDKLCRQEVYRENECSWGLVRKKMKIEGEKGREDYCMENQNRMKFYSTEEGKKKTKTKKGS